MSGFIAVMGQQLSKSAQSEESSTYVRLPINLGVITAEPRVRQPAASWERTQC